MRFGWVAFLVFAGVSSSPGWAQELREGASLWASDEAAVASLEARVQTMARAGELVTVRTQQDEEFLGRVHERMDQFYGGVRVFGGQVVRQSEQGRVLTISGKIYSDVSVDLRPTYSAEEAVQSAARPETRLVGEVELLILPLKERYALAYHFRMKGQPSLEAIFVDAHSGKVLLRWSDLRTQAAVGRGTGSWNDQKKLSVEQQVGTFRTNDLLRPARIKTYNVNFNFNAWNFYLLNDSSIATDADNVWTDGAVVDAHAYVGYTYDYYFKRHGRRGLDGQNLVPGSYVHFLPVSAGYNNAFFDPTDNSLNFGDGDGRTFNFFSSSLDVVAHELTHGVTQFTSNLIYLNEPGALNEAFSDIIGTSVEFFFEPSGTGRQMSDWLVGEDLFFGFGPVIRNMSNPAAVGDPDHYSKRCLPPICTPNADGDNGGVHINSEIVNQAFYLLVDGGTNRTSGITVTGLGRSRNDRAEKIFYRAFTVYLTPTSNFSAARAGTIQAARDLYGAGGTEEQQVIAAWTAVGVN